jgi:hypothetical protein
MVERQHTLDCPLSEAEVTVGRCHGRASPPGAAFKGADRVTTFPARPPIPVRPAAYIRDSDATTADDLDIDRAAQHVISVARDRLGWPVPAVYADVGPAVGSQYAALVEAITAGRHDAVIVTDSKVIGGDLAMGASWRSVDTVLSRIEAFHRLCRQHAVRVCLPYGQEVTDTRALFDVIHYARDFTVTDEHLRLLRRAYIWWGSGEFGAPEIDTKRPYGNSSVFGDIAEILGVPDSEWADVDLNPLVDAEWRFLRLHVETAIALQITLATGEFRTGRYLREEKWDTRGWKRDEASN